MLSVAHVFAQNRTVTGTVKGKDDGLPIPGVSVRVKGTSVGTQTGSNGGFRISAPAGATLTFSSIGYITQNVAAGTQTVVDVTLLPDARQLSDVQIVAAGGLVTKQRAQGYATTRIDSSRLTAGKATNVAAGLTGKVAGLQINAVSSGVNPNVRIVLRGQRSLTGNNQALIVLDNVIVPNSILGNINPEDVADIQVLNGAGAAALYGTAASNGALLITTKKGTKNSATRVTVSNTTNLEQISYYPKLQDKFGSGSASGYQIYTPFENQQYGPAYDGSLVQIGRPLADGSIQTVPYTANRDKYNFWQTGITNQTDFSLSNGDAKSTLYFAGQYVAVKGTTPQDKYNRASFRLNGTRDLGKSLFLTYATNYVQNRYDQTTVTSSVYDNLLNTPSFVPLLSYKDYNNNPFANQNGYYNEYYQNPYFAIGNNRQKLRNDYFIGSLQLDWKVADWVTITARPGITTRNQSYKNTTGKFTYTEYTKGISSSKTDIAGGVTDNAYYNTTLYTDLYATFKKQVSDFNFNLTLGANITNNQENNLTTTANGLVIPGFYNQGNRVGESTPSQASYGTHTQSLYGDLKVGYKDFLFLEVTGRNDWTSLLAPENRSFFYPSANLSYIPTAHLEFLKDIKAIDQIKIRGGVSKVGNVNVGPYSLVPTYVQTSGFPFGSLGGYSASDQTVSLSLRPEITKGFEVGTDFSLYKSRIVGSATYYVTNTSNQTLPVNISRATGFSTFLANTGEVRNEGIEATIHFTPLRTATGWELTVGGNFTYNNNTVVDISNDLSRLPLSTGGLAQVYAIKGYSSTTLVGTDYYRDPQGRVIVDPINGYPTVNPNGKILGNTTPKQRLGLDLAASYKGFRLSGLFEFRGNYVVYNDGGNGFDFSGAGYTSAIYNRERFVYPNSSIPDPNNPGSYIANNNITVRDGGTEFWTNDTYRRGVATNYVYSGNYWKLREAALSYDFPQAMFRNNKYIKGARISLQGRNLFIWLPKSNVYTDPDYSLSDGNAVGITTLSQTPPTRFYSATVTLNF
ncbi:SusC/RagA family TonB-linked outer membrane protein [Mucilaginibacter koreensis]